MKNLGKLGVGGTMNDAVGHILVMITLLSRDQDRDQDPDPTQTLIRAMHQVVQMIVQDHAQDHAPDHIVGREKPHTDVVLQEGITLDLAPLLRHDQDHRDHVQHQDMYPARDQDQGQRHVQNLVRFPDRAHLHSQDRDQDQGQDRILEQSESGLNEEEDIHQLLKVIVLALGRDRDQDQDLSPAQDPHLTVVRLVHVLGHARGRVLIPDLTQAKGGGNEI